MFIQAGRSATRCPRVAAPGRGVPTPVARLPITALLSPPGQPARRHGSPNGPRRPSPRSYPSRKANASSTSASSPIASRVATSASPVEMDHVSPEEQVRRYLQGCHGIPASPPNFAFALFRKLGGWDPRLQRQGRSIPAPRAPLEMSDYSKSCGSGTSLGSSAKSTTNWPR